MGVGKRSRGELKSKREAGTRAGRVFVRRLGFFLKMKRAANKMLVRSNCSFRCGEGGFEGSTAGKLK